MLVENTVSDKKHVFSGEKKTYALMQMKFAKKESASVENPVCTTL